MLFLLDGTPGSDILCFLARLQEETLPCTIMHYDQWLTRNENSSCAHSEPVEELSADKKKALEDNPSTSSGRALRTILGTSKKHCIHPGNPEGIILMRVLPEIAHKRLQNSESHTNITLDYIQQIFAEKDQFYIQNKNNPQELQNLPVLVLNGNIDFKTDFSQFYNHLFYIRRFIKQIEEKKEIALGIHKEKKPQRKCC